MSKYMSAGMIDFIKGLIDQRVGLLIQSEVKHEVKNQVSNKMKEVEASMMKLVEQGLNVKSLKSEPDVVFDSNQKDREGDKTRTGESKRLSCCESVSSSGHESQKSPPPKSKKHDQLPEKQIDALLLSKVQS